MFKKDLWEYEKNSRICSIDIDVCLADYPKCWIDFANKTMQTKYKTLNELKENYSYNDYKRLKKIYRLSGEKAKLPLKKNAKKMITELKKNGYKIILLTARPYREYRRIWKDTIKWLRTNKIKVDGIIWDKEKHLAVLREFPYMEFMVEDNAEIANQVARLGYKVYVVDNEYNQQPLEKNCFRVMDLLDICKNEVV